jgi:prolyl 4-hydroxylase
MKEEYYSTKNKTIFSVAATAVTFLLAFGLNVVQERQEDVIQIDQQDFQIPSALLPGKQLLPPDIPVRNEYGMGNNGVVNSLLMTSTNKIGPYRKLSESYEATHEAVQNMDAEKLKTDAEMKDKKMRMMKGTDGVADFEAYVREKDVSTFYGEEPGSRSERTPKFEGMAGKFVNLYPYRVSLYWNGFGNEKLHQGDINPWGASGTSTFPKHQFVMTPPGDPDTILCSITTNTKSSVYYCDPFHSVNVTRDGDINEEKLDDVDPSQGKIVSPIEPMDLTTLTQQDREAYNIHQYNRQFSKQYRDFTGSEWLTLYPPIIPKHKIWPATKFGQTHIVESTATHLETSPSIIPQHLSIDKMRRSRMDHSVVVTDSDNNDHTTVDKIGTETSTQTSRRRLRDVQQGTMNLTLRVVSVEPRILEIQNFLSDFEVDHLLNIINPKRLVRSRTGSGGDDHISETRTSTTTWIPRNTDSIVNRIFLRVSDALQIDEGMFRQRNRNDDRSNYPDLKDDNDRINEDIQIVHYNVGEQYTAHHDFGYPKNIRDKISRSINLCMYLNDVPAGGETSFPRWRNGETNEALNVKPVKGKAVIFYMITPDGNLDDLTQHAALPVIEGEKYFANLWIHSF